MKRKTLILAGVFVALIAMAILLPKASKAGFGGKESGANSTDTVYRITTTVAGKTDMRSYLEINGDVEADNTIDVFPDIAGKLIRLRANLGTKVNKGDVIAEIDPSKPGASYAISPVYAPISGTITSMPQKIGATVSTGTVIAIMGDINNLQVTAKISERDIAVLKNGLTATITFEAYPGAEFEASVFRVSPVVDSTSRTKEIFLSFANEDARINAGMFAKIKLYTTVAKNCITIPNESIITLYETEYAYLVNDDGTVTKREVKKGVTVDGVSQIISGLKEGDRVALEGITTLTDGAKVKDIGGNE